MNRLLKVLFLDIETVSASPEFDDLDTDSKELWQGHAIKRFKTLQVSEIESSYFEKAGIFAEFGKIICISVGYFYINENQKEFRLKSFVNDNERQLLIDFADLINHYFHNPSVHRFCGHNIKEFDIPYLCRRMLINGVEVPRILNLMGKKPWENKHVLDTMELWKFGDYKNYTSLHLLASVLGLPTPKDDICGSDVSKVYWLDRDLQRIANYCEKDVITTAKLYAKLIGVHLEEDLLIVSSTFVETEGD